ncbi:hypothetical protein SLNSH_04985 [Alsobacter soli]|uniref:LTXXQ motif family protein n=1 Tax=Alsobacter soli TaxID=2109933 RepID=A0A2T1HX58_9HYPH|nr:Spy/CpxP family protein refolding chaperone [Alsobacter soli]PSC06158.1 hypothetical protein SLNSH_04985 [Alsobacter soli]
MLKLAFAGLTSLVIVASGPALAQGAAPGPLAQRISQGASELLNAADWKALTESRIDVIKTALQLTPEQAKLWPAVEDAIRSRAQMRYLRLQALATPRTERRDVIELMRDRADVLSQRSAALKKLADAWQPLFATLDGAQKARLKILAVYMIHEARDAVESRRMQLEDEYDGEAVD